MQAAPVLVSKEHLRNRTHRAIVVNAGCANACTGTPGLNDARQTTQFVAEKLGCKPQEVLVCSTGVIGTRLNLGTNTSVPKPMVVELFQDKYSIIKRNRKSFPIGILKLF